MEKKYVLNLKLHMMKTLLKIICLMILLQKSVIAAETASQTIQTVLSEVLEIEKVYVATTPYNKNDFFTNVAIENVNTADPNAYILSLTPMSVQIRTNLKSPIYVDAEFLEMIHSTQAYQIPASELNFSPTTHTISTPYNGVVTGNFVPIITTTVGVLEGLYNGKVMFTLGKL